MSEVTKRANILVVDDDALILMSVSEMVKDLGHRALEASSGSRALEILRSDVSIDLLITDQAMPGMTGIQLAQQAKAVRPGLKILFATGYNELPPGEHGLVISKPFRQAQLKEAINSLLA